MQRAHVRYKLSSEENKSVGIWIRVSTEDQAHGESPEVHEKRARMYAEARNWKVREVYRLDAVSGKAVIQHPEAQRMLADIRSGHISSLDSARLRASPALASSLSSRMRSETRRRTW